MAEAQRNSDDDVNVLPKDIDYSGTRSLFVFGHDNPLRVTCINVASSKYFLNGVMGLIVINCLFLCFTDPVNENTWGNDLNKAADWPLLILFTLEMVIKFIAMGVAMGPNTYMKDRWNWMDFAVVLAGWLEKLADAGVISSFPGMDALRTFRLLRPLRTLTTMPGMKVVVKSMIGSLGPLLNVGLLAVFIFFVFGIIGVQLYNGAMDGACYIGNPATSEASQTQWYVNVGGSQSENMEAYNTYPDEMDAGSERACAMYDARNWPKYHANMIDKGMGRTCDNVDLDGDGKFTVYRYCARANPGSVLTRKGEYGTGSFDNIGTAMVSIFTSITLEGWVDISYRLLDAFGLPVLTCIYFILMILLGSFFLLNLALAVIEDHYNMEKEAAEDEAEQNANDANNLELSGEEPEDAAAVSGAAAKPAGNAYFASVIETDAFEKIVIGSICLNAVTMAMEYHGASSGYNDFLKVCNYVFTFIFVVEMVFKILGLTFRGYVRDPSNVFDAVLVFFAVLEIILVDALDSQAPGGISALRSFRILKLAKTWPDLNRLLTTLKQAIVGVSNASVVLLIIVFIFTLLGMQLFGGKFTTTAAYPDGELKWGEDVPRHHFDNLWWAFVSVFQVLTGENWNEVLYNGILGSGWAASVIYFTLLNIVGAYIILNLFMAILLGQFEDDDEEEEESGAVVEVAAAPQGDKKSAKVAPAENSTPNPSGSDASLTTRITEAVIGAIEAHRPNSLFSHEQNRTTNPRTVQKEAPFKMTGTSLFVLPETSSFRSAMFKLIKHPRFDQFILFLIAISSVLLAIDEPYLKTDCDWVNSSFVDTLKVLDLIIVILFVLECVCKVVALGFVLGKDSYLRNGWNCLDFFLVLLSIVMLASEGNESLAALRSLRALRALRPLRVLSRYPGMKLVVNSVFRALPAIVNTTVVCMIFYLIFAIIGVTNWKGALNACNTADYDGRNCKLGAVIPTSHPGLECAGTCNSSKPYPEGTACDADINACTGSYTFGKDEIMEDPSVCGLLPYGGDQDECSLLWYCGDGNFTGSATVGGPPSNMFKSLAAGTPQICDKNFTAQRSWSPVGAHFDDVGNALLTVFEVSSGEMWPDIMYTVVDAVTVDGQSDLPMCAPSDNNKCGTEHAPEVAIYFILVTIMCAFLLLNLFVGVVVDSFDKMKKEGVSIVTDEQQLWIDSQIMALECAPVRKLDPPTNPLRRVLFKLVESKPFELGIMAMIMLNVIVMAARVFDASKSHHDALVALNYVFIVIFAVEAVLKLIGLGPREYFLRNWCRFDFTLVVLSIVLMEDLGLVGGGLQQYATLARVLRVARMFRLMQTNKQLLTMFKTLVKSFPSIANVACVTLLLFFIYACLGMNLYANLKQTDALGPHANFEGFWMSMYILFRMSTGESYNGLMRDAMISGEDCVAVVPNALCGGTVDRPSNCGSAAGAPLYFLSFFILSSLLMLNLLVAIILDNFGDTQTFENCAVQHGDLSIFSKMWSEFDPKATGFMDSHDLERFLRTLPLPLGVDPGEDGDLTTAVAEKVKRMDIPERAGNVSFNEVLSSLCSLAVPQVILPQDLLHSEMMKDLITKKNNIPSIRRDDKHQRTVNRDMFEKKGRLYTIQERHFARVIQARLRGAVARAKSAARLRRGDAAVVPEKKEAEV